MKWLATRFGSHSGGMGVLFISWRPVHFCFSQGSLAYLNQICIQYCWSQTVQCSYLLLLFTLLPLSSPTQLSSWKSKSTNAVCKLSSYLTKNHKAAETLTIILTALFFSYLPVTVLFRSAAFSDDLVEPHMLYILSTWSHTFAYFCSLLNPLIYCWRLEKLRGALFDTLHLWQAQDSSDVELQTQRNNHRPIPVMLGR